MKYAVGTLVAFMLCGSALAEASEGVSVLEMPNGDVEIVNVGSAYAAPRTIVALNTNADCRVVCQVYCLDNANPQPDSEGEIALKDKLVNMALGIYLRNVCQGLSPEEVAGRYRAKSVCEDLFGFPQWLSEQIQAEGTEGCVDLTVVGVSMRAVGDLANNVTE